MGVRSMNRRAMNRVGLSQSSAINFRRHHLRCRWAHSRVYRRWITETFSSPRRSCQGDFDSLMINLNSTPIGTEQIGISPETAFRYEVDVSNLRRAKQWEGSRTSPIAGEWIKRWNWTEAGVHPGSWCGQVRRIMRAHQESSCSQPSIKE